MIIDSHCHLTYEPMSESLHETIERANRDGVKYILTISTEDKSFDKIINIISKNECVYGSYGIHPHEAKNHQYIKSENKLYYEIRIREEMMVIFIYLRDKVKHKVEYKWCSIHALVDGKKGSIADVNHFYQQFLVDLEANCVEMFDAS